MVSQFSVDDSHPMDGARDSCAGSTPRRDRSGHHRLLDLPRIFDLSQGFMCITDARARFLRVGASAGRILGYQPHELIGRKFLDFVHPGDVHMICENPCAAIAGFTGLLRGRHCDTIDADGRRCIDRVLAGAQECRT